jgi:folate-dependent phosphoribosylglycinamide formyltransferase PurN
MKNTEPDLKLALYLGSRLESLEVLLSSNRVEKVIAVVGDSSLCNKRRKYLKREYGSLKDVIIQKRPKSLGLEQIQKIVSDNFPDLILSVGCPYILKGALVREYKNRIFNIHPHILPERPGWDPVKESHDNGEMLYGATLHHITEEMDRGDKVIETRIHAAFSDLEELYQVIFSSLEPSLLSMALKYKLIPQGPDK